MVSWEDFAVAIAGFTPIIFVGGVIATQKFFRSSSHSGQVHGLFESIAAFGSLEEGILRKNSDLITRSLRDLARGAEIMVEEGVIARARAVGVSKMLNKIGKLTRERKWEEATNILLGPGGLQNILHDILRSLV